MGRNKIDSFFTLGMSLLSSILLKCIITDVNAQPKMFHRKFLSYLNDPPHDFSLDLYLLYFSKINKLPILELPVTYDIRKYGKASLYEIHLKKKLIVSTIKYILGN